MLAIGVTFVSCKDKGSGCTCKSSEGDVINVTASEMKEEGISSCAELTRAFDYSYSCH